MQRCLCAVDSPEIADLRDAPVFLGRHLVGGREDCGHRIVNPDIDRAEDLLDPGGCGLDLVSIGDIGG